MTDKPVIFPTDFLFSQSVHDAVLSILSNKKSRLGKDGMSLNLKTNCNERFLNYVAIRQRLKIFCDKVIRVIEVLLNNLPKGGFHFISGRKNLPGLKSILKILLHFYKELFFFATTYLYFHAIAHDNSSALTTHVFFYMHEINKKRFMNTKKNGICQ